MKHIFVIVLLLWCFLALAGELKAENVLKDVYDNREIVAPINSMEYSECLSVCISPFSLSLYIYISFYFNENLMASKAIILQERTYHQLSAM